MNELKTRIEAKKKKLEADLLTAKADAQGATSNAISNIKARLHSLEELLSDGWDDLTDDVSARLNSWLGKKDDDKKDESTKTHADKPE